jgi:hypothetical protein
VAREVIEDPASVRLLIAAEVGPVRLIDNCAGVEVGAGVGAEVGAGAAAGAVADGPVSARPENVPARHLERIA